VTSANAPIDTDKIASHSRSFETGALSCGKIATLDASVVAAHLDVFMLTPEI
jgi:hypothetical protein